MELRIVRLLATLGFFGTVTAFMVAVSSERGWSGAWGYLVGAVLFGAMTAFLWKDEASARADERAMREVQAAQSGGQQVPPPNAGGARSGTWN